MESNINTTSVAPVEAQTPGQINAAFEASFTGEAKPSLDTPVVENSITAHVEDGKIVEDFFTKAVPDPQKADPIFKEEIPEEQKPSSELKPKEAGMKVEIFLQARNALQSYVLAGIAKSKNPEKYKLDEEQLSMLAEVYAPYAEQYGGNIPNWVMILVAEAMTTGKLIFSAIDERRTNTQNQRLVQSPAVQNVFKTAVEEPAERKKYVIDENGYYVGSAKTNAYIKKAERTEKASLTDIELIVRDTGIDIVRKAFPEMDLTKYEQQG